MNNKLNEIRRKISFLRSEMLRAEDAIRKTVNRNEDCTVASLQVMAMRTALLVLISERNRLAMRSSLVSRVMSQTSFSKSSASLSHSFRLTM